jgi:uncharacterized membrane protein
MIKWIEKVGNNMYSFFYWFLLFFIYSTLGWILEMLSNIFYNHRMTNRGFLIGPYCPIYGTAALLMIIFLRKYEDDILVLFVMSIFLASILEYITSYLMEKLFRARWWDYSNRTFNVNGRICLKNSILFGFLGIILVAYVQPFIRNSILYIPKSYFYFISIICFIIFLIDVAISFKITINLKHSLQLIKKDNTDEISKKVKETIQNSSKSFQRLFKAFPNMKPIEKKKKK